jgi:transposase-like protein
MDERLRFVARLLDGEAMSEVCRAFGISRKTGYKIFERYKEHGLEALTHGWFWDADLLRNLSRKTELNDPGVPTLPFTSPTTPRRPGRGVQCSPS